MSDIDAAARVYYCKITDLVARKQPGAPFKKWEELPEEQREMSRQAMRAAVRVVPPMEILNDLRRCAQEVLMGFTDEGDHYEYTGSMNAVEDLRDATAKAREHWIETMP